MTRITCYECPYPKCNKAIAKKDVNYMLKEIKFDKAVPKKKEIKLACCPTPDCPFIYEVENGLE